MITNEFDTAKIFSFNNIIDYADHAVVSKTIIKKPAGTVTLFAFDKHEELSEHTAPFDALVQIVDGTVEITIGDNTHTLKTGQSIVMPATIPHAVKAIEKFKMILTMIKQQ